MKQIGIFTFYYKVKRIQASGLRQLIIRQSAGNVSAQAMKAQGEQEVVQLHSFLTSELDGPVWTTSRPVTLPWRKQPSVPTE
jgi:ribosomal protein L18